MSNMQPPFDYGAGVPNYYAPLPAERSRSGLGMASFIMAVAGGFLVFGAFGAAMYIAFTAGSTGTVPSTKQNMLIGFLVLAGAAVCLVGLVLGVINLMTANSKRLLGILGTCINGLVILTFVLLMIVGLVMRR